MSRKPQIDLAFHDAPDPRCELHAKSGEPVRRERTCPPCNATAAEQGTALVQAAAESMGVRKPRHRAGKPVESSGTQ